MMGAAIALTPKAIGDLLTPFLALPEPGLLLRLSVYLELLLRWNARTNLTAIRTPEEIVARHFGESLFAAQHLGVASTLLDYGSGAGFPGLPIALARPDVAVTLAESQHKKSAFLREAIRILGVDATVWSGRVAQMPPEKSFDCVTLRAVDDMASAMVEAERRASTILLLTTVDGVEAARLPSGFILQSTVPVPESVERLLVRLVRV